MIEFQKCRHCKQTTILDPDNLCSDHCATRRTPHPDPEHICPDDKITPAVVEKYVAESKCPFCDNEDMVNVWDIEEEDDGDGTFKVFRDADCDACNAQWKNIYHFAGIETINTNGGCVEAAYLSELPEKNRFKYFTGEELMTMRNAFRLRTGDKQTNDMNVEIYREQNRRGNMAANIYNTGVNI